MSSASEAAIDATDHRQLGVARFDPVGARRDFPILQPDADGKRLVFLDSAASAQKPQCVIDAISDLEEA